MGYFSSGNFFRSSSTTGWYGAAFSSSAKAERASGCRPRCLERMVMRHMAVRYDNAKDELIYARTLKNGAGEHVYGLEVCKYLKLPKEFMSLANSLSIPHELTSLLSRNPSHYNAQKINN